jgi:hypothetical protein
MSPVHPVQVHDRPEGLEPARRLRCMAGIVAGIALGMSVIDGRAGPIPCSSLTAAVTDAARQSRDRVSTDEAATAEAVDAARQCLTNIARSLNQVSIPGVPVSIDFGGILRGMLSRACRVVTTQIDQAGRVVNGSVSGSANRVIRDVNATLPAGQGSPVTVGVAREQVLSSGSNTAQTSTAQPATATSAPASSLEQLSCVLRGSCK